MRKRVRIVCLTMVLALIMTVIASPSYGTSVDVEIKLKDNVSGTCDIELKDKRFKGVCKSGPNDKKCDGDEFSWVVKAGPCSNLSNWTLVISSAPNHPACFVQSPIGIVAVFSDSDLGPKSTGPPVSCTNDKYGTYWPYVIWLYDASGALVDSNDPGGIIFP